LFKIDDVKPMTMREAIEAAKIIAPYAPELAGTKVLGEAIHVLLSSASKQNAVDILRLVALGYHESLEVVGDSLRKKSGADLVALLGDIFIRNSLVDLINLSAYLGLSDMRWNDGR